MLNAKLFGLARRVQGVRKQEESRYQRWFGGTEYCGLASTVGVATEKNPACRSFPQNGDRIPQTRTIAFRVARRKRRSGPPLLAEGQIAAQNHVAMSGKRFAERYQQRSSAIRARAVSQDQRVAIGVLGRVQKSAYSGIEGIIAEFGD
jgi:hypothetical protein